MCTHFCPVGYTVYRHQSRTLYSRRSLVCPVPFDCDSGWRGDSSSNRTELFASCIGHRQFGWEGTACLAENIVEYARIVYTDLNGLRLLAE
jgi:hypothetical protein